MKTKWKLFFIYKQTKIIELSLLYFIKTKWKLFFIYKQTYS